ncbi:gamma-glutamyl-gamma-aminobutyrate hydrolase family protein [Candidatus Fermentibacteria bacterium]|nr:gamma-glutamyl-gamma-aminobutyrate hydrolase family protein [Candidatus Fermentibacteria bacterium]
MEAAVLGFTAKWKANPPREVAAYGEHQITLHGSYVDLAFRSGAASVLLLPRGDPEALLNMVDLLVLTGGGDPDPSIYGDKPVAPPGTERERPLWDIRLYRAARKGGKPVLGICLGMQLMAVAEGCGLIGDIATELPGALDHHGKPESPQRHPVSVKPGSVMAGIIGTESEVSSFHHQAIRSVPPGYSACAWSPDGLVEAIESEDGMALGVQWHPERDRTGVPLLEHMLGVAGKGRVS